MTGKHETTWKKHCFKAAYKISLELGHHGMVAQYQRIPSTVSFQGRCKTVKVVQTENTSARLGPSLQVWHRFTEGSREPPSDTFGLGVKSKAGAHNR